MKKIVGLIGEKMLSGVLYDNENKLSSYKSSSFIRKISKYDVYNYSFNNMNSTKCLEYIIKILDLGFKFKSIVLSIGQNESDLGLDFDLFKKNLNQILDILQENKIKVVLIGVANNDLFNEFIVFEALRRNMKYINNDFTSNIYSVENYKRIILKLENNLE